MALPYCLEWWKYPNYPIASINVIVCKWRRLWSCYEGRQNCRLRQAIRNDERNDLIGSESSETKKGFFVSYFRRSDWRRLQCCRLSATDARVYISFIWVARGYRVTGLHWGYDILRLFIGGVCANHSAENNKKNCQTGYTNEHANDYLREHSSFQ